MLSGILEEDEGWLVAQLMTNQNETIGDCLRPTISSNCLDEPQKQFPLDLVLSSVYGQGSIRLRHGPKWNEVMSNFSSLTAWAIPQAVSKNSFFCVFLLAFAVCFSFEEAT